ncbi:MAG: hypothetical protein HY587_06410 [Candidatus Omnitrophica bacterium]|nr:hypothetical protein [Candidatus Omnitrophota bacterium]
MPIMNLTSYNRHWFRFAAFILAVQIPLNDISVYASVRTGSDSTIPLSVGFGSNDPDARLRRDEFARRMSTLFIRKHLAGYQTPSLASQVPSEKSGFGAGVKDYTAAQLIYGKDNDTPLDFRKGVSTPRLERLEEIALDHIERVREVLNESRTVQDYLKGRFELIFAAYLVRDLSRIQGGRSFRVEAVKVDARVWTSPKGTQIAFLQPLQGSPLHAVLGEAQAVFSHVDVEIDDVKRFRTIAEEAKQRGEVDWNIHHLRENLVLMDRPAHSVAFFDKKTGTRFVMVQFLPKTVLGAVETPTDDSSDSSGFGFVSREGLPAHSLSGISHGGSTLLITRDHDDALYTLDHMPESLLRRLLPRVRGVSWFQKASLKKRRNGQIMQPSD